MCETGVIRVPAKAILVRLERNQAVLARQHPHERIEQALLRFHWRADHKTLFSHIEIRRSGNVAMGVQPVFLRLDGLRIFCIVWLCFGFRGSAISHACPTDTPKSRPS